MPIEFPPPPPPVVGDIRKLEADASQGSVTVAVAGFTLIVHAPGLLDEAEIAAVTTGFDDVSAAVRALAAAAQRKGAVAAQTLYVRRGTDIYVSIVAGHLRAIKAPEPLKPYFAGLVGDEPLTVGEFEKKRLLAGIHASRMGAGYTPVFTAVGDAAYDLGLKPSAERSSPGSARVNLSNVGNRFTGREFLDLDARRGTDAGDEFSVLARTSARVLKLDDVEGGSDYHEYQAGWSRVTPVGLFGVYSRYLDYRQEVQGFAFDGELWTVDAGYTGVLTSTATQRITLQGKADYIYKRLQLSSTGQKFQEEPYPSLEAGAAWSSSFRLLSQNWLSLAALSARKGLGAAGHDFTRADLSYWLLRPSYSLRTQGSKLTGELQLALQYSNVTVPEQQQWIVGGVGNLSAYVPGVALGDRGLLARATADYNNAALSYLGVGLRPRAFAELAVTDFAKPVAGIPRRMQSLSDLGAELVVTIGPFIETALIGALPLHDSGVNRQVRDEARANFFFRFTARF